jgi:predicted DCC family thiol-disulfide oxidoreductase YuxK
MTTPVSGEKILIRFDGICILCSKTVRFILNTDRRKKFQFQALQNTSDNQDLETIIVTQGKKTFTHFDAVLKIGKELGGIYRMVSIFQILPKSWRKSIYLWIARNRFSWFGKRESCYLPSEEEKDRFI